MDKLYQSKCFKCGDYGYIFPDQVEIIKRKGRQSPFHKWINDLYVGQDWICIRCNSDRCKIHSEIPSEKAGKLIKIRSRETNVKASGFILPNTNKGSSLGQSGFIVPKK